VATTITSSTAFVSLFKAAWDSLIADLDNGVLKDLPNKDRGRSIKIQANKQDKNRIDFYTKGDELNTSHWATFSGILEIHKYFKSPSNINNVEDIRKVCKGSQTSTLWAIYNEVYNRANKLANTRISPVINEPPYEEDEKVFIFVIDEINRGDMSKIFGELFFSIDPGYRGIDGKINTQYQNMLKGSRDVFEEGFYIPKNVYIIGTMNDIDRSVESMDFAMRRRFQFIEVTAEQSAKNMEISGRAKMCMTELNNCIIEIGLSTAYQIGGAYFLKEDGNKKVVITEDNDFEDLCNYRLNGLLREYLRGEVDADTKIKKLKEAYDKGWKNENAVKSDAEQEDDASGDSTHE
jgi:5-methylcytosine-specific restriction endonuclease McrBC GTP-binding regulatory subunit McrB